MSKPFQIASIYFDENALVTGLRAYATDTVRRYIADVLKFPAAVLVVPGSVRTTDGRLWIKLNHADIMRVYQASSLAPDDSEPMSPTERVVHDELHWVYCSLLADD